MKELPQNHGQDPCVALVPIFSGLTTAQQHEVARFAHPRSFDKGEMVMHAGQRKAQMFVIHEGQVKVTRGSWGGRETIVRVLEPGDVGGEEWFLTGASPENDVVAIERTQACVFEHAVLAELIGRFPDIGAAVLASLAQRLVATERMLAARTLTDVGGRIADFLLGCPMSRGDGGVPVIRLPFTKKETAAYLGTTPETLSRRLGRLQRDGLIRVRGSVIEILDPRGLEKIAFRS